PSAEVDFLWQLRVADRARWPSPPAVACAQTPVASGEGMSPPSRRGSATNLRPQRPGSEPQADRNPVGQRTRRSATALETTKVRVLRACGFVDDRKNPGPSGS